MDWLKILGLVVIILLAFGLGPLLTIWTLNTLFMQVAIAYTFKTWLATVILHFTVAGLMRGKQ